MEDLKLILDTDRFGALLLRFYIYGIVLRLILIGESVKKLSEWTKAQFPELEWSQMARFRDLAVHHYSRVDALQVWEIIQGEIPKLLAALTP